MSDEIAPAEPETTIAPVAEREVPHEIPSPVDEAGGLEQSDEQSSEPEYVEVQRNGKTYTLPKELEGELLMQSDYTKKTQTVAEKAKALESREAEINHMAQATEAELDARAQLHTINQNLAYYAKFTQAEWDAAHDADPMGTDKAWRAFEFLRHQKADLDVTISKTQSERSGRAQQDLAKRVQDTIAYAQKEIPGFKPELTDKLVKFALDEGMPEDILKANWSPVLYKLLHRASIGTEAMKRQAAAPKSATPAEPIVPLQTVAAKAQPAARLSLKQLADAGRMEEYAAARRAGRTR